MFFFVACYHYDIGLYVCHVKLLYIRLFSLRFESSFLLLLLLLLSAERWEWFRLCASSHFWQTVLSLKVLVKHTYILNIYTYVCTCVCCSCVSNKCTCWYIYILSPCVCCVQLRTFRQVRRKRTNTKKIGENLKKKILKKITGRFDSGVHFFLGGRGMRVSCDNISVRWISSCIHPVDPPLYSFEICGHFLCVCVCVNFIVRLLVLWSLPSRYTNGWLLPLFSRRIALIVQHGLDDDMMTRPLYTKRSARSHTHRHLLFSCSVCLFSVLFFLFIWNFFVF